MDEDLKIKNFWKSRSELDFFLWTDLSELNANFINQHLYDGCKVLDLGCGDANYIGKIKHVVEFTLVDYVTPKNLVIPTNAKFIENDIRSFSTDDKFDIILLFGVANFFGYLEVEKIYHKCYRWLKPDGKLLVKHQCGVKEDILVDKFSENLNSNYVAYYGSIESHSKMLKRSGFTFEISDPYPMTYNKWEDTAFKAFVCKRSTVLPYSHYFKSKETTDADRVWHDLHTRRKKLKRNRDKKWKLLELLKFNFDKNNIPFYLMYGTLLGAVREKDFIEWDADIDVGILDRSQGKLAEIALAVAPLKLARVGDYYLSFEFEDEFVDIYTFTEGVDKYKYCNGLKDYFDEKNEVFEDYSIIQFRGKDFLTVKCPVSSLERWYGNWEKPMPRSILTAEIVYYQNRKPL